jgi:chromosome segregation ATPase
MSTAGKVLSVLVTLATLAWMILAAGVAQLQNNYSKALHDLEAQYEQLGSELEQTRNEVASLKDQTSTLQEKTDTELTVLRERVVDLEKERSRIVESLTRWQYQLAMLEETIAGARATLEHRNEELKAEDKALADSKAEVQTLMADTSQLMDRLKKLRETFQSTQQANRELVK